MSASLVGSEMCIRDRASSVLGACCTIAVEPIAPVLLNHWWRPRRGNPVSYTHLTLPTICSV
eukprot:8819551-Alexandrium_andersonii.AAC.1